jgi:ComF family protein
MPIRPFGLCRSLVRSAQSALDFLLPIRCLACHDWDRKQFFEPTLGRMLPFCRACQSRLVPDIPRFCDRCGASAGLFSRIEKGCPHCRNRVLKFDRVICLAMYEGALREFMLRSKWSRSPSPMQCLALLLWKHRREAILEFAPDCILPVPQHWTQRCVRHFNSAWMIAETISLEMKRDGLNIPCYPHILRRNRIVKLQKRSSLRQRFENQNDSFELCASEQIHQKRILIVDDVLTTGATCSEAASILKTEGAAACAVLIAARVLSHSSPVGHLSPRIREHLSDSELTPS